MIIRQFRLHCGLVNISLPVNHNALLGIAIRDGETTLSVMLKEDEPHQLHHVLILGANKPFDHQKGYRYAGSFEQEGELYYTFVEYIR